MRVANPPSIISDHSCGICHKQVKILNRALFRSRGRYLGRKAALKGFEDLLCCWLWFSMGRFKNWLCGRYMGKRVWKPQRLSVTVTETFTVPPQMLGRFAELLRGLFVATDGSGASKHVFLLELSEELFSKQNII